MYLFNVLLEIITIISSIYLFFILYSLHYKHTVNMKVLQRFFVVVMYPDCFAGSVLSCYHDHRNVVTVSWYDIFVVSPSSSSEPSVWGVKPVHFSGNNQHSKEKRMQPQCQLRCSAKQWVLCWGTTETQSHGLKLSVTVSESWNNPSTIRAPCQCCNSTVYIKISLEEHHQRKG